MLVLLSMAGSGCCLAFCLKSSLVPPARLVVVGKLGQSLRLASAYDSFRSSTPLPNLVFPAAPPDVQTHAAGPAPSSGRAAAAGVRKLRH